jgi:VWFA-related protein
LLAAAILPALFVLPLTSTLGSPGPTQIPPSPELRNNQQQNSIQVRSSLVQVDAFVTDKDGKRIENLNAGNFQLSEENRPQKLTAVDYFDVTKTPAPQSDEPIYISLMDSTDSEILQAVGRDHRLIVLFFDLTSFQSSAGVDIEELLRSVLAAKKFVKEQMTPADLVTVTAFSKELVVEADFTNDRAALDQALDSLLPGKNSGTVNDRANASTLGSLAAAEALSKMLSRIPGRKSVIHFTGGLPSGDKPTMERTTGTANKFDVSFYEIDTRGLATVCTDASKAGGAVSARGVINSCLSGPQFDGSRSGLDTLAQDTGGALFVDLNDFTPFFKYVQDDSTGYYLLSFESSNTQHDGRYRIISVKLIGVPGGHIKYRPGYVAPRD